LAPDQAQVVAFNTADEVYYTGEATRADADYLGAVLTDAGLFGSSARAPYGATVDSSRLPHIPCGQPRRPPWARRPREGVMGKELAILAHDTVDQPPPATGI
jgi:hypothetical protein